MFERAQLATNKPSSGSDTPFLDAALQKEDPRGEQMRRHGILMEDGEPSGGRWNFDAGNREAFGAAGPGMLQPRTTFEPDALTRAVISLVHTRFADHPGWLVVGDN